ncbi:hypothetical protein EVAR_79456_1 [Eumeta japonica]|uniref:Uncharacterized protein n=1 Tax=Eumeta variegata TaxID=151549 RepID=A0A4C1UDU8_EUMVA|nr:hypothetical protein EVAR_79456_1 [Eumeta japonica]
MIPIPFFVLDIDPGSPFIFTTLIQIRCGQVKGRNRRITARSGGLLKISASCASRDGQRKGRQGTKNEKGAGEAAAARVGGSRRRRSRYSFA